jgi:hypothetical protein
MVRGFQRLGFNIYLAGILPRDIPAVDGSGIDTNVTNLKHGMGRNVLLQIEPRD